MIGIHCDWTLFVPQDYDAMIKLVENLNNLPTCQVAKHQNIKFHYIFALNRYLHTCCIFIWSA